jgi:hypothetical protein
MLPNITLITSIYPRLDELALWPGHGADGLGGFTTSEEWDSFKSLHVNGSEEIPIEKEHAASALVRIVNEKPGDYE